MSAEIHQLYIPPNSPTPEPKIADVYRDEIDLPNAERERRQLSEITNYDLQHEGKQFHLTTYRPTDGLRTYKDDHGSDIQFPELLMVHGVASDASYFWEYFQNLNKLGIACAAIELPREHHIIHEPEQLLEWQAGAVVEARSFLQAMHANNRVIVGGHSRGCIVSSIAAEKIAQAEDGGLEGVLFLAPSMETKNLPNLALNLAGLAINSFRYSGDLRLVGHHAMMIAKVVVENPQQTYVEVRQALGVNVKPIVYGLADTSVFIPTALNDEFVDADALAELARNAPNGNVAVVTLPTNHMLGQKHQDDVYSLGDPRTLEGQTLAWMQSLTPHYRPLSATVSGRVERLDASRF